MHSYFVAYTYEEFVYFDRDSDDTDDIRAEKERVYGNCIMTSDIDSRYANPTLLDSMITEFTDTISESIGNQVVIIALNFMN